ncbi:Methylesterase 17 [Acorus calamus]|uniref:Methylesterase 17 n=1 Tax=Acorus calamus TaxID=4465 RepID=A0AAV9EDM7_ACOCL|nr:Methylesterase 17 [Acorus calamus]
MGEMESPHFVLVHGLGHGAWCWYMIRCLLEASGYKVSCVDLLGAGIDRSDADSILSFKEYNRPLIELISTIPKNEQIILVGHSAGGLSVTHAIYEIGERIAVAVYVAATMLRSGFLTDEDRKDGIPDLSEFGDVYEFGYGLGKDKPPTSGIIRKEFQREILYHLSPMKDSTLASMLVRPGPAYAIGNAKFEGEGPGIDRVMRVYIKTEQDRVLKQAQQEAMLRRWPPREVFCIESEHSPFFSAPGRLADMLVKAMELKHGNVVGAP